MVENVSQYSNSLVFSPSLSFAASEPAGQVQVWQHIDINTEVFSALLPDLLSVS